jgi:hypothetical protein
LDDAAPVALPTTSAPGERGLSDPARAYPRTTSPCLYAIPRQRSIDRFKDKVRALTRRRIAVPLEELIHALNSVIRGWGMYFRRANVRRLFNRLNMWIVRRIWEVAVQATAQRRMA